MCSVTNHVFKCQRIEEVLVNREHNRAKAGTAACVKELDLEVYKGGRRSEFLELYNNLKVSSIGALRSIVDAEF